MPLFYLCAAFLFGVLFAGYFRLAAVVWLGCALGCLLLAVVFWALGRDRSRCRSHFASRFLPWLHLDPFAVNWRVIRVLPLLASAAFLLGGGRRAVAEPVLDARDFIAHYNDDNGRYTVIGILALPPDHRDQYTNLRVNALEIRPANGFRHLPVEGVFLARVQRGQDWQYGDRIAVTGALKTPGENETFSYRAYLARQGVYSYMPYAEASVLDKAPRSLTGEIYNLKERAFRALHEQFPDPEASLLAGILLGLENGLSPDLQRAFRDTGTSHIIAISGFNIAIISGIFMAFFGRVLGPRVGTAVAVLAISLYTLLVGADPAVLRAAVMGGMAIVFKRSGRLSVALSSLMLTAAVMTFINPLILADVGFQLSFAATVGLVLYAEPLTKAFGKIASRFLRVSTIRRLLPVFSDAVLLTLAAQITTLPLILYHFGRLSLTSFIVNPLILPVQPAVMVLGGLSVLGGMAWQPVGVILAMTAFPFTAYTIRLVELFSQVRGGVVALDQFAPGIALLALAGPPFHRWLAAFSEKWRTALPVLKLIALLVLLGVAVSTWRLGMAASPGQLRMWLLDVGMGEAVLIQTPEDRWMLINGGPSAVKLSDQLGRRIPFGHRSLDWLIVAGTADEQISALPNMLERYLPGRVLWAGLQNSSQYINNMQDIMNDLGVPVIGAVEGQSLDLGGGAHMDVLTVTPRGAVLLLRWNDLRILIPTGIDFDSLSIEIPAVSALLLPDSAYEPLNPPEWIEQLQPGLILISVEAGNRAGLPGQGLLAFLKPYALLRTDVHGWISLTMDGQNIWVETAKPGPVD